MRGRKTGMRKSDWYTHHLEFTTVANFGLITYFM